MFRKRISHGQNGVKRQRCYCPLPYRLMLVAASMGLMVLLYAPTQERADVVHLRDASLLLPPPLPRPDSLRSSPGAKRESPPVQLQPGESRNRRPESKDEQKDQPSDKTTKRLLKTERGVDLTDPTLYESVELGGDSSTATVAGMATGYDLPTYQRFVGSLRKSGYKGNIILGVAPDVSEEVLRYFRYRNVTPKIMKWVNCTYASGGNEETRTCAHPYQDIKIRWSRFPLIRDWLLDCKECTGPVLVMDVRDSFFQLDPFGPGSPTITGLQVYEEDKSQTTGHWLTKGPLQQCLGVNYEDTMLCSGTTTGTRAAMIKYLHIMYEEMKYWIEHEECRFNLNGDDQSIHNHLFYSGQFPFATPVANRRGGIVNTVGVEGAKIFNKHKKEMKEKMLKPHEPYPGSDGNKRWIGKEYNICDDEGFFIEFDGSRSRVIHQWDRFGVPYTSRWLNAQELFKDPIPPDFESSVKKEEEAAPAKTPLVKASLPRNPSERRTKTDTGVLLTDPALFESVDLHGDSSTATVMGMAAGYDLKVYESFVGSLRKTGYNGHIILGVAPDVSPNVLKYLRYRNVTVKVMKWANCTYRDDSRKGDIFKRTECAHPYTDIKIRWSRFPLQRDWLLECETCTGPVLTMDVRDSIFQRDPFGPGSPELTGLQVYEEHKLQTTLHWLAEWPISTCKGFRYNETMLCSRTTTGTRAAMLKYLEIMYEEMKVWINTPHCRFDINGDDQSIHNYLFYSGQLPFASAIPNREGGIVNTVGVEGSLVRKAHEAEMKKLHNLTSNVMAAVIPYKGATTDLWIGEEYGLTDGEGFFSEFDGSRSRVIHQYDRFGSNVERWFTKKGLTKDPIPYDFA